MPHEPNWSYRDVVRNRQLAGLLLGDLLANAGTGMIAGAHVRVFAKLAKHELRKI